MSRGARLALLALATFACVALRYAPIVNEPLDGSLASWNAQSTARYIRCYQEAGFFEVRGIPQLAVLPTIPPTVQPYLHHPPGYPWLAYLGVRALGYSELAFRAVPILFAAFAGALLVLLIAHVADLRWAAAGALLYAALPMSLLFGWMPNPESGVLACMVLTVLLHERLRSSRPRAYAWVYAAFLAGTLLDWQMNFIAPALWLREWLEPARDRRLRRTLWLLPLGVASFAAVIGLFSWWLGSFEEARAETLRAATTGLRETHTSLGLWLAAQGRFWTDYFTWPVALLTAAALPGIARAAKRDPLARHALLWLVPAALNVIVFTSRASNHDFWWFYALPYAVLSCVWILQRVPQRRFVAPALLALCVAWSAFQIVELRARFANALLPEKAAELNRYAGAGDGITTPIDFGPESFYLNAWVLPPRNNASSFQELAALKRADRLLVKRVVAIIPEKIDFGPGYPSLDYTELVKVLPSIGKVRRLEHEELKREAPLYAAMIPPSPVWILTIE